MAKRAIKVALPRYECFAVAALFVSRCAGVNVQRVLQSLRPRVHFS